MLYATKCPWEDESFVLPEPTPTPETPERPEQDKKKKTHKRKRSITMLREGNRIAAAKYRKKQNLDKQQCLDAVKMHLGGKLPPQPQDNERIKQLQKQLDKVPMEDKLERNRISAAIYRERQSMFHETCMQIY